MAEPAGTVECRLCLLCRLCRLCLLGSCGVGVGIMSESGSGVWIWIDSCVAGTGVGSIGVVDIGVIVE